MPLKESKESYERTGEMEDFIKSAKEGTRRIGQTQLVKYLSGGTLHRAGAIKAKCYDCDGMGESGVCEIDTCSLFPYSPYKKIVVFVISFLLLASTAFASETKFESSLLNSIRKAEGNKNYGVISVKCKDGKDCRKVALNTIRNQYRRFAEENKVAFLKSLAERYCPIGSNTDDGTCVNWFPNVLSNVEV